MFLNKHDERRRNEQFVRDRIEQFPQIRNLIPPPRQLPIDNIRQRSDQKDHDRERIPIDPKPSLPRRRQQHNDQQRNDHNTPKSDVIRQIHTSLKV